jgi:beta-lactamase class A
LHAFTRLVKTPSLALALALLTSAACASSPTLRDSLDRAAAGAGSGAVVAATVLDLSTGARSSIHGDARLPMMSVFKLPLAIAALDAVDRGELSLAQAIPIAERELAPGMPIADAWARGERSPTLEVLLTKMIQDSDNTAGDKMVAVLGGGAKITARLRALGVGGIDIGEPEAGMSARLSCPPDVAMPAGGWTFAAVDACPEASEADHVAAARRELAGSPNVATTDALIDLLRRLDRGGLLSDPSRRWLLATLAGTSTGPRRIKGLLPPGTPVAHKTGTGGHLPGVFVATNDVGIVTRPDGRQFAIGVLVTGSSAPMEAQERTIAELARAAWDWRGP